MIATIVAGWISGRTNNRGWGIIGLLLPGILGGGLMAFLPSGDKFKGGKLAGIYLTAIFGPSEHEHIPQISPTDISRSGYHVLLGDSKLRWPYQEGYY